MVLHSFRLGFQYSFFCIGSATWNSSFRKQELEKKASNVGQIIILVRKKIDLDRKKILIGQKKNFFDWEDFGRNGQNFFLNFGQKKRIFDRIFLILDKKIFSWHKKCLFSYFYLPTYFLLVEVIHAAINTGGNSKNTLYFVFRVPQMKKPKMGTNAPFSGLLLFLLW